MQITITAKIKILPTIEQIELLKKTISAYKAACNHVSVIVNDTHKLQQPQLHKLTYVNLRTVYGLKSQMAQSVIKTVIARYKTNVSNGHEWALVNFKRPEYDLVWNRDYSIVNGLFSINTLDGRAKIPFETKAMEQYFDGTWSFGTSKLVNKYNKYFLHIPMTKDIPELDNANVNQVVGIDMGINFIATTYDSQGKTQFFNGKTIKHKRANYKKLRKQLQQRQTPSSRQRLKAIGQRENRWMTDVNHRISKALVNYYGPNTIFAIEDLTGIRQATEKVRIHNKYVSVSWAFYQLRQMLEYKANINESKVVAFDPRYTSQTCPKCGHVDKTNRNK